MIGRRKCSTYPSKVADIDHLKYSYLALSYLPARRAASALSTGGDSFTYGPSVYISNAPRALSLMHAFRLKRAYASPVATSSQ